VHLERLNLSIFTGRLSEEEMKGYHAREYERLTAQLDRAGQPDQPGQPAQPLKKE
jgi:hypothetical protein